MHTHEDQLNKARGNALSSYHLDVRLAVAASFIPKNCKTLCDVGCGEGYFLQLLEKKFPKIQMIGIDISSTNLIAAMKNTCRSKILYGDALNIPLKANRFDVISALEIIDHFDNPLEFLLECKRLLKPGGFLILSLPAYENPFWKPIWFFWTKTLGRKWDHKHLSELTSDQLKMLLENNTFINVQRKPAFYGLINVITCQK